MTSIKNHTYEKRFVADLIPYVNNSRVHTDEQVSQVAASIKEFGITVPVLIDETNSILAGHCRVRAMNKLAIKETPVIVLQGLTEAQKKAYVIADNKLTDNSTFDLDIVKLEMEALKEFDFDLSLTGFTFDELDDLFGNEETEGLTDEDDIPELPDDPVSAEGDIWLLGEHRLMCGDSTDAGSVAILMDGHKADMVFTDPPYRLETEDGCKGDIGKSIRKYNEAIKFISEFEPIKLMDLLPCVFAKNKHNSYIFCNKELLPEYLNWAVENKISFNVLVWKKPNAIPIGDSHRPDIEYLLLFRKNAIWNNGLKDVNYSRVIEQSRENGLHPTMKPVNLIENEIKISSNRKSPVLDLFGGSGSTLIACEKTNRKCFMMELDPHYVDVIIKRWQDFTGRDAVNLNNLKTYGKLKAEKGV